MTGPLDHLLAFVLIVGVPVYVGVYAWPRIERQLVADAPGVRVRMYWTNIAFLCALAAAAVVIWLGAGRSLGALGLGGVVGGWRLWVSAGGAGAITLAMIGQYVLLARSPHGRTRLREALLGSAPFVPRNPREMGHFTALSVAAGTCEEILYRGFLIWYVCTFTGTTYLGVGLAVVLTSATFAVCHLYQGPANAVRVGLLSLVFGTLYVVAESLWVVMAFHATIDVAIGAVALLVLRAPTPGAASDG